MNLTRRLSGCLLHVLKLRRAAPVHSHNHVLSFRHHCNKSPKFPEAAYEASLSLDTEMMALTTKNANEMFFPFVWLRDNCQCNNCFHQDSQSRTIDLKSFNIHSKPKTVKVVGDSVQVLWLDGHLSEYKTIWLEEHSFHSQSQRLWLTDMYRIPKKTWTANEFNRILSRHKFGDILKSDSIMKNWLVSLATFGVSIIEDAPPKTSTIRQLAERVAFLRKTHYGEEFSVKAKPGTTNVAYLSANLQLHTDLPYYSYKPGVNLLHCLIQTASKGGSNQLTDAMAVAEWLKADHNNAYQMLVQTVVDWNDIGEEDGNHFHSIHRAPVVCENSFGEVERINFSQPQRDSHLNIPLDKVKPWYEAMDLFTKAVHNDRFCVSYKMKEGEILTFDNIRLLHGRNQYEDTKESVRHIIGGYLDWDEVWSRIRVLKKVQKM